MAFTVWRDLPGERVRTVLPPPLRKRAGLLHGAGPFTVVLFHAHDVVTSRAVTKALRKVGEAPHACVAAGVDFTAEARELLTARGAQVLAEREFQWTDASYAAIRQS